MAKENLKYNHCGNEYFEIIVREDEELYVYEGRHGKFLGKIIDNEIYNLKTGLYIGELKEDRLLIDVEKQKAKWIKANMYPSPFGRNGHACIGNKKSLPVPKGYIDFNLETINSILKR